MSRPPSRMSGVGRGRRSSRDLVRLAELDQALRDMLGDCPPSPRLDRFVARLEEEPKAPGERRRLH